MKLQSRIAVLGGADPANPLESDNKVRHTAVGMLLLAVGAWAFTASTAAFHSNLHASWPLAVLGGALIAMVVFSIDLLVTATPLKDTNLGSRMRLVLIRGMVSLAMGLVISHATILFMYRDTLAQMVSAKNTAIAAETTERITRTSKYTPSIDQAKQRVDDNRKQIIAENQTLNDAQQKLTQLQKAWSDDTVCVNGNRAANGDLCGPGPSSNVLKAELDTHRTVTLPAIVKNHDEQVAALTKDIEQQSATITDGTEQRNQEIKDGVAATLANTGLAAQTDALVELLRHDLFAWLWPVFFIVIDLAVALMKGVLPESDFDRARRSRRALASRVDDAIAASQTFQDLVQHAAAQQAKVMKARIDHDVDRQLAALQQHTGGVGTPPTAGRGRKAVLAGLAVLIVALSLSMAASNGRDGSATAASAMQARGGQSITLRDGLTLHVPERAVSGNAPVTVQYREPRPWAGHTPRSATVALTTSGALTGRPQLRLAVPPGQEHAAQAGDLLLAFQSDDPSGWTQYPITYDPTTNSVVGELTHFSNWQFWEWDWIGIGASVSQTIGQWTGRRSDDVPQCDPKKKTPAWFNFDAGITNEPAMVVRSCLQGHDGDDVLDVQIVNNRPYGLMLHYNGAAVKYGWHEPADSLPGAFRDIVGDLTAGSKGLYLPPLSRASVGIIKIGSGKQHKFPITPTAGTVTADLTSMLAQELLNVGIDAAGRKWVQDIYGAAAAGSCSRMVINTKIPDWDTVYQILTGAGPQCIKDILVIAARNEIRQGAGMDLKTIGQLSAGISKMTGVITKAPGYLNKMGDLLDFGVDQRAASVPELGFGFSILARSTDTGGQNGNNGGQNGGGQNPGTGTSPLMFAVTGSCTTLAGTLSSTSSGFTPTGRYTVEVRRPDGSAYTGFTASGTVRSGGNIMWTWPCAGDPVGTYTTRITDNSTGRVTSWTPFTIGAAPGTQPPAPPTPSATTVKAYDNYGPVTTAGVPMCAGNPGRPESMPGGSVSQTFAVPNGVANLDTALVQIDFNADMTVHATLSVNGTAKASNDQTPNNDTTFTFPRVSVRAGDTVTLTLTWTGRKGKLDTIYMTGNPPASHLVITNTCSDGAPSLNRTNTGLRAVISGWSA